MKCRAPKYHLSINVWCSKTLCSSSAPARPAFSGPGAVRGSYKKMLKKIFLSVNRFILNAMFLFSEQGGGRPSEGAGGSTDREIKEYTWCTPAPRPAAVRDHEPCPWRKGKQRQRPAQAATGQRKTLARCAL